MLDLTNTRDNASKLSRSIPAVDAKAATTEQYPLPIVSVIVVNYNYGKFLREAVESVIAQTYPFIECLIVDDCSTDNSPEIIDSLKREFPQVQVVKNTRNGGQSASSLAGMENSVGDYIIFLDADDYLYPTCVEIHIQAHLALRMPVGFTSVDMVQIRDGRIVTAAAPCFSKYVSSRIGVSSENARDLALNPELPRLSINKTPIGDLLHYVDPIEAGGWPWSPTSGNCFRRDALHLITHNEKLASLRSCTDCYLLRGVACLTGSALIDRPLVAYRLHGKNDFVTGANLNRIRPYDVRYLKKRSNQAMVLLIDHLIDNALDLTTQLEASVYFRQALDALDAVHPPINDTGLSYVTRRLILNRKRLRVELGASDYDEWMVHRAVPAGVLRWFVLQFRPARYVFGAFVMPMIVWAAHRSNMKAQDPD